MWGRFLEPPPTRYLTLAPPVFEWSLALVSRRRCLPRPRPGVAGPPASLPPCTSEWSLPRHECDSKITQPLAGAAPSTCPGPLAWLACRDSAVGGPRQLPQRVKVQKAYFGSHAAGVAPGDGMHAGDFIVICEGVNDTKGDENTQASGWAVARHWLSSELPALCWLPGDGTAVQVLQQLRVVLRGDVAHGGAGSASGPRRAISGMKDGVPFIVVSLCFNTDDFQSRVGTRISLGGIHMSYLSWRFPDRRNSHACRVISVAPARVDSDLVLEAIKSDLVEGVTQGWMCRRTDGAAVRVLADVACALPVDFHPPHSASTGFPPRFGASSRRWDERLLVTPSRARHVRH